MPARLDFIDNGAPEFFVTELEFELIPDSNLVRMYAINVRGGERVLQYTTIVPRHRLMANAQSALELCVGNPSLLGLPLGEVPH